MRIRISNTLLELNTIFFKSLFICLSCVIFTSCDQYSNESKTEIVSMQLKNISAEDVAKSIVEIRTFDHYKRQLKSGYGIYISAKYILTNLDLINEAYSVDVYSLGSDVSYKVRGYVNYNVYKNLILLESTIENKYVNIVENHSNEDTLKRYFRKGLKLYSKKEVVGKSISNDSLIQSILLSPIKASDLLFTSDNMWSGIVQNNDKNSKKVVYAQNARSLLQNASTQPLKIHLLKNESKKEYISHKRIKGFRIHTTKGDIELVLFDDTPEYRDNFIKLVCDHFYDSLLFHRVIPDFIIQTGAADSKYAKKDDVVGWQGPGYTLPTRICSHLFHKRGVIAASKLPEGRNPKDRSDGSQFYIVTGRKYSSEELDNISNDYGVTFTKKQRRIYSSVGGAPHLDGKYTIFGRVTRGLNIAEEISKVNTYAVDRPMEPIRIKTIEIILW